MRLADPVDAWEPTDSFHQDIGDDEIEVPGLKQGESVLGAVGDGDIVSVLPEDAGNQRRVALLVVDDLDVE